MLDSVLPFVKHLAILLKPIGPDGAIKSAIYAGTLIADELNSDERRIIGNSFLVIGSILIKRDDLENNWQQKREVEVERLEIELELQKLQKRIDDFKKRTGYLSNGK
jgi:hypothetical protein